MRKSSLQQSVSTVENGGGEAALDWELRPGGMLVQKRDDPSTAAVPMVKIKVAHGSLQREVSVPAQATFGELKRALAKETGLDPQDQRLLFRGKEKDNDELLHTAGVKDMSKVVLLEDPASKERKLEGVKNNKAISEACDAVARIRLEVDKLAEKISPLESAIHGGIKVADKEFVVLSELLMLQLLQLDGVEAEGEAKVQRRIEVRRIQNYVETLDVLKARNANPFSNSNNAVTVTTQWETFESGMGSLTAPRPGSSSTMITNDWEVFD